jgi:LytS/YehU family sensor histidine kinase
VPSADVEKIFFSGHSQVHALEVLRRRLHGLFGRSFRLEVSSHVGQGTTVTLSIPLRMQFEVSGRLFESDAPAPGRLASG